MVAKPPCCCFTTTKRIP